MATTQLTVTTNLNTVVLTVEKYTPIDGLETGGYEGTAQDLKDDIDAIAGGLQGSISISDTPTEIGYYFPTESGTYINAGGIVVDLNDGLTTLIFDGIEWSSQVAPVEIYSRTSLNLFEPTNVVEGSLISNSTGNVSANAVWLRTGAIPIDAGETYTVYGLDVTAIHVNCYSSSTITGANWLGAITETAIDENAVSFVAPIGSTHLAFNIANLANKWDFAKDRVVVTKGAERKGNIPFGFTADLKIKAEDIITNPSIVEVPSFLRDIPENGEIIFIQTGQSNATEHVPNSAVPLEDLGYFNSLKMWDNATLSWKIYYKTFAGAPGLHNFNLGLARLIRNFNKEIRLVNYSVSATAIAEHLSGGSVYTTLKTHVENAINDSLARGKFPVVYMLFVQGEADSNDAITADAYEVNQNTWVDLWRENLGEKLPIIMATIYERGTAGEIARDKQINDAKRVLYKSGVIQGLYEVESFPTDDDLHRNYAGYQLESKAVLRQLTNIGKGIEIVNELPYTF